jgi:peroxiredoxin Q/BCP
VLEEGVLAPNFALPDGRGSIVRLEELRGRWVVLWWYPKASSGVCSIQGRAFEAAWDRFRDLDAEVLGVSFDEAEANCAFADAESFSFTLLSDPDATTGTSFEVLREDSHLLDRARRITYLIDPRGFVRKCYDVGSDPQAAEAHALKVAADLEILRDLYSA